jgi:hypothetical protein
MIVRASGEVKIPTLSHKSRQGWGTLWFFVTLQSQSFYLFLG